MAKKRASRAKSKTDGTDTPVGHRAATAGEASLLERGRKLAASYLVQRDGMDEETAAMVIDSLPPEEINQLITDANTEVMERTKPAQQEAKSDEENRPYVDFSEVQWDGDDQGKAIELTIEVVRQSRLKNEAEAEYKKKKAELYALMAKVSHKRLNVLGVKLESVKGATTWLSEVKLVENGVDPAVVKKSWDRKEYPDVRVTVTAEAKEAGIGA